MKRSCGRVVRSAGRFTKPVDTVFTGVKVERGQD